MKLAAPELLKWDKNIRFQEKFPSDIGSQNVFYIHNALKKNFGI